MFVVIFIKTFIHWNLNQHLAYIEVWIYWEPHAWISSAVLYTSKMSQRLMPKIWYYHGTSPKNMYVYTLLLDELESYVEVIVVCFSCRRTLQLARQLKDRAVEAQACYSLGNTYTLLQDYERAIDYHLKHLIIAQDLKDRYTGTVCLCCCSSWRLTLSLSVCV